MQQRDCQSDCTVHLHVANALCNFRKRRICAAVNIGRVRLERPQNSLPPVSCESCRHAGPGRCRRCRSRPASRGATRLRTWAGSPVGKPPPLAASAVSALSRSGLIEADDDEGKKRYQLTQPGKQALATRHDQLSAIEVRCGVNLPGHCEAEAELRRLETAVTTVAPHVNPAALLRILRTATSQVKALGNSWEGR